MVRCECSSRLNAGPQRRGSLLMQLHNQPILSCFGLLGCLPLEKLYISPVGPASTNQSLLSCNAQGMQGTAIAMNVDTVARLGAQAVNLIVNKEQSLGSYLFSCLVDVNGIHPMHEYKLIQG